jgi:hypothetical protein
MTSTRPREIAGIAAGYPVRLDAEHGREARLPRFLEEQPVVAADLQHRWPQRLGQDHAELVGYVGLRLPAGEAVVELAIELLGVDRLGDLDQTAGPAEHFTERIALLGLVLAGAHPVRDRHRSQVERGCDVGRAAEPAGRHAPFLNSAT